MTNARHASTPSDSAATAAVAPHRRTLAGPAAFAGVGIHSGLPMELCVEPAPSGSGLVLERTGSGWDPLALRVELADAERSDRRTVVRGPGGQVFEQIEHILAALAACGVSDARLVFSGHEPPFLDGGAGEFTRGLLAAGLVDLAEIWVPLTIEKPFALTDGAAELVATPHAGLRLSCFVEFPGTVVGSMGATLDINTRAFLEHAAPARTFARQADIDAIRKAGLGKGGTLDNTVVFNENQYLNPELHFPDEVARHKIVDALGDLALIGRPVVGHVWAWRSGHRSHVKFAQALAREYPQ